MRQFEKDWRKIPESDPQTYNITKVEELRRRYSYNYRRLVYIMLVDICVKSRKNPKGSVWSAATTDDIIRMGIDIMDGISENLKRSEGTEHEVSRKNP
jgi:hypothetical protein